MGTKIQWADKTWNPVVGCSEISSGCKHCYAVQMARRLEMMGSTKKYDGLTVKGEIVRWTGEVRFCEQELTKPRTWKKPQNIFVCSMGDLFHRNVSTGTIKTVLDECAFNERHTFKLLTKRPAAMAALFRSSGNIQWGVTVEHKDVLDRLRWFDLCGGQTFVSCEPLLSPIDFNFEHGSPAVDQVIVGCESGPNARPADIDWIRDIRDQCRKHGVKFFLKQMKVDGKLVKMPALDGTVWDEQI